MMCRYFYKVIIGIYLSDNYFVSVMMAFNEAG